VTGERADHRQPALGAGRRDVQPPLAAVAQQRAPLVAHPPVGVLAVADRQDDRVPLVALHPLQVLDEERLWRVFGEERLKIGGGGRQRRAQREVDPLGVPHAQRDHPEGLPGAGPGVLQDQPDHLGDLCRHQRLLARPVILRDHHVPQAVVSRHARERGQRAAVDPVVGERHQALVA
jgi:hypothetical protein